MSPAQNKDLVSIVNEMSRVIRELVDDVARTRIEKSLVMLEEIMSGSVYNHGLAESHDAQRPHIEIYKPWAFCPQCESVRPVLPYSFTAPHQWSDVVCKICGFNIATLSTGPLDGAFPEKR